MRRALAESKVAGLASRVSSSRVSHAERLAQAIEQAREVGGREHRRRAAAEVEGAWRGREGRRAVPGLGDHGIDEGADVGVARGVLEERAIRADPVAKGDVDVGEHAQASCSAGLRARQGLCRVGSAEESTRGGNPAA